MNKIVEKTKDFLIGKQTPITKESANMLALTGKICTTEERVSEFIKDINETIIAKARVSLFRYMVELPPELISQSEIIEKDFADRGFSIHKFDNVIIISWN